VFARTGALAEEMPRQDIVGLMRNLYHSVPTRRLLFVVTGVAARATERVGGAEAAARQFEVITDAV
jgi:hypothetical protein